MGILLIIKINYNRSCREGFLKYMRAGGTCPGSLIRRRRRREVALLIIYRKYQFYT